MMRWYWHLGVTGVFVRNKIIAICTTYILDNHSEEGKVEESDPEVPDWDFLTSVIVYLILDVVSSELNWNLYTHISEISFILTWEQIQYVSMLNSWRSLPNWARLDGVNVYSRVSSIVRSRSWPIWKFLQILSSSLGSTWRMGIHSWYALTAASFRSVKQAPEGEKEHPAAVSFESAVPAFQELSATWN